MQAKQLTRSITLYNQPCSSEGREVVIYSVLVMYVLGRRKEPPEPPLLTVVAWALHSLHGVKICVGVRGIRGTVLAEEVGESFRRSHGLSMCAGMHVCTG